MKTSSLLPLLIGSTCLALAGTTAWAKDAVPAFPTKNTPVSQKPTAPRIEVCFVLDTTGSMGGLIEGAKQKIWSIANEIVKAKPSPELKIGLVAFRDRGDDYVTKPFELTSDIDTVYAHLMGFGAAGGGDGPESVNEAIAVAVRNMAWSPDKDVLKIIFLVGDAPPHTDYPNDTQYPELCQEAVKHDLIINTVQCGSQSDTTLEWQKIARLAEGRFTAIGQTGNVAVIATPVDKDLAELNAAIGKTLVPYGKEEERKEVLTKQALSETVAAPAASDRLAYNLATRKAVQGGHDLVEEYQKNKTVAKDIPSEQLPENLKGKKAEEIEVYLQEQQAARTDIQKKIAILNQQRALYIAEERKKQPAGKDSFDDEVAKMLREQATKKGLSYQ